MPDASSAPDLVTTMDATPAPPDLVELPDLAPVPPDLSGDLWMCLPLQAPCAKNNECCQSSCGNRGDGGTICCNPGGGVCKKAEECCFGTGPGPHGAECTMGRCMSW